MKAIKGLSRCCLDSVLIVKTAVHKTFTFTSHDTINIIMTKIEQNQEGFVGLRGKKQMLK